MKKIDKTTAVYVEEGFLGYDSCAYVFETDGKFEVWMEDKDSPLTFQGSEISLEAAKYFISTIC